jgi:uncharacterized protein (TIGR02646 family)
VRAISKGVEPPSLIAHRQTPHCDYDNYPAKDELRRALVNEQRGLCCYCMGRIQYGEGMKIEHWHSQAHYPGEQLSYRNLLGACFGGHGQPPRLQHCDTRKGDRELQWNPADPAHHIETRIRYEMDGTIWADHAVFDEHLKEVLNLNLAYVRNNRKAVLIALLEWWQTRKPMSRARVEREIERRTGGAGNLTPYCQVAVWWLKQRLARMTA